MGKYIASIGSYYMILPDYAHSRFRGRSKKKEYYTKKTIEVIIKVDEKEEELRLPFNKIFKVKKDNSGFYYKDWESFDLRKTLWMELVKRGLDIYLTPYVFVPAPQQEHHKYFLESPLLDDRIQLSNEVPQPILIEGYEIFKWFDKHGLTYK